MHPRADARYGDSEGRLREEVYKPGDPDLVEGKADLIIARQRNGPTGTVRLAFIKKSTRFANLAQEAGPEGY